MLLINVSLWCYHVKLSSVKQLYRQLTIIFCNNFNLDIFSLYHCSQLFPRRRILSVQMLPSLYYIEFIPLLNETVWAMYCLLYETLLCRLSLTDAKRGQTLLYLMWHFFNYISCKGIAGSPHRDPEMQPTNYILQFVAAKRVKGEVHMNSYLFKSILTMLLTLLINWTRRTTTILLINTLVDFL